jgi:hypothetical protein
MHIINFLIAIFLPYISLFSKLAPPETIPAYFFSSEAAFLASEFTAIVFYWAGFVRNYVARGTVNERQYFGWAAVVLVFMCITKIIFTLPYTWITDIFAFGLGVLSVSSGQTVSKKSLYVLMILSAIIGGYAAFILIGMAWFDFTATAYYHYQELIKVYLYSGWHKVKALFPSS